MKHPYFPRFGRYVGAIVGLAAVVGIAATLGAQESSMFPQEITPPLGLGEIAWPTDNPYSAAKAELGWYLYYDTRLSADDTVSCGTCHSPLLGFADGAPVSTGIAGQKGGRSAPVSFNQAYNQDQFWDGRAVTLEEQVVVPIANPIEMGETHDNMVAKLTGVQGYAPMFQAAFGSPEVTIDNVAQALATFERTLLSGNSAYDRYQAGDVSAMNEAQIRGLDLFRAKANCDACHGGPNFTWNTYHNLGIGLEVGVQNPDTGRFMVTGADDDWGRFKTPTLRDISKTGPYMHNGSLKTLYEVVEFYNQGGNANENLDNRMIDLNLTEQEERDLVAFLEALDGMTLNTAQPSNFPE